MSESSSRGLICENLALQWYQKRGYSLLNHRFRSPFGEIDLILRNNIEFLIVEVKSISDDIWKENRVSEGQKKRLRNSLLWLQSRTSMPVSAHLCLVGKSDKIEVFEDFLG